MKIGHLGYIFSIVIFGGSAILHGWRVRKKMLRKYEVVLLFVVAASVPFTALAEFFALRWGAWEYYPQHTLNATKGAEVETYLFAVVIVFIVGTTTLASASLIDRQKKASGYSRKQRKLKP